MPDQLISILVPCYNEQDNIPVLITQLEEVLQPISAFEIILINDGSTDFSLKIIKELVLTHPHLKFLSFSKNFGHQNAIKAGLDHALGDAIIMMDSDLQHPPKIIPQMIQKWKEGFDIVYTKRKDTQQTTFSKKITAKLFYKLVNALSDTKIEENTADFRLVDRKVADIMKNLKENDLFWRGLIFWLGFKSFKIDYEAQDRFSGTTKYSFGKMFSFALKGITSFSVKPLRIAIFSGIFFSMIALLYGVYAVYIYLHSAEVIPGWTSTLVSVLFIGGIQLITLGIIGEYLGKLFIQSKNRPHYIIQEKGGTW